MQYALNGRFRHSLIQLNFKMKGKNGTSKIIKEVARIAFNFNLEPAEQAERKKIIGNCNLLRRSTHLLHERHHCTVINDTALKALLFTNLI